SLTYRPLLRWLYFYIYEPFVRLDQSFLCKKMRMIGLILRMARIYRSTTIVGGDDMSKKFIMYIAGAILLLTVLSGCFQGEQSIEEMDPPENSEAVDGENKEDEQA